MGKRGRKAMHTAVPRETTAEPNNRFRNNDEGVEEPRQLIVLGGVVTAACYLGFRQRESADPRGAMAFTSLLFLVHCFLQCRDTMFVRPHPGFWRLVHGIGMLYLFGVAVLLCVSTLEAQVLVQLVFPGSIMQEADSTDGGMDCDLTLSAMLGQMREIWFVAHVLGWWAKMCLFRDWRICWVLSISFELLELSLGWMVPQFHECWWDSLLIDLLGANQLGMLMGLLTLRFFENTKFDWNGFNPTRRANPLQRALRRFSPISWNKWQWEVFSSVKRFCQIGLLLTVVLMSELNAFLMLNALSIPKNSYFNMVRWALPSPCREPALRKPLMAVASKPFPSLKVRLITIFMVGLPGCSEYYEYVTKASCKRLGQNAWLILAIMQIEILCWVKHIPQAVIDAPAPVEVKFPLLMTFCLFSLWALLSFSMSKPYPAACEAKASETAALVDKSESSGSHKNQAMNNEQQKQMSGPAPIGSFLGSEVAKHMVLDSLFVLSFVPLLYLAKQWFY
ncbi:unnamed protein product [Chrysoparadoxa australica]